MQSRLARFSLAVTIADDDPLLVGRRRVFERTKRQRFERTREPGIGTPAGFRLGMQLDGAVKRNPVPVIDGDPFEEIGVTHRPLIDFRHHVAALAVNHIRFHQERQARHRVFTRPRPMVLRVRVAQTIHQQGQLAMKLQIAHRRQLLAQMLQPANHIDTVKRTLQRQVRVNAAEHLRQRIDDVQTLGPCQRRRLGGFYRSRV